MNRRQIVALWAGILITLVIVYRALTNEIGSPVGNNAFYFERVPVNYGELFLQLGMVWLVAGALLLTLRSKRPEPAPPPPA